MTLTTRYCVPRVAQSPAEGSVGASAHHPRWPLCSGPRARPGEDGRAMSLPTRPQPPGGRVDSDLQSRREPRARVGGPCEWCEAPSPSSDPGGAGLPGVQPRSSSRCFRGPRTPSSSRGALHSSGACQGTCSGCRAQQAGEVGASARAPSVRAQREEPPPTPHSIATGSGLPGPPGAVPRVGLGSALAGAVSAESRLPRQLPHAAICPPGSWFPDPATPGWSRSAGPRWCSSLLRARASP